MFTSANRVLVFVIGWRLSVERRVGQVRESVREVGQIVLARGESCYSFLVGIEGERVVTRDAAVETQVPLVPVDEVWRMDVLLNHVLSIVSQIGAAL